MQYCAYGNSLVPITEGVTIDKSCAGKDANINDNYSQIETCPCRVAE